MNKYGAVRCWSDLCQRMFDSKAERDHGEGLRLRQLAGEIFGLEYQPWYPLCENPRVAYVADFRYREKGRIVVEDVKGVMTGESRVKIAWVKEKYGVEVILIRR